MILMCDAICRSWRQEFDASAVARALNGLFLLLFVLNARLDPGPDLLGIC